MPLDSVSPPLDDDYRVRLLMHPGVSGSDYINASYIDVSACDLGFLISGMGLC